MKYAQNSYEIITRYSILSGMNPKKSAKTNRMIRNKAIILIAFIYSPSFLIMTHKAPSPIILQLQQEKEVHDAY
jgi:hypothetical protein